MPDEINCLRPLIMHIDLNSCFASIEQQARPRLRGRPVAVVNRSTDNAAIITASYEAKAKGVRVGMRVREARRYVPDLVVPESDPPKYRFVYRRLRKIMRGYPGQVTMKSIDEGIIDFRNAKDSPGGRPLRDIGMEIKRRLKDEIGSAMRCNVGIGTNRFLAKTAAGLHKPDGLDIIDGSNLRTTLAGLKLNDLSGIASHNEKRLNAVGIYSPLQFLDADESTLVKMVFGGIVGSQWYRRLRGWEVDDAIYGVKSVGRQYVLERNDLSQEEIGRRLFNLAEAVGGKLRHQHKLARGVRLVIRTESYGYWRGSHLNDWSFNDGLSIYRQAVDLLRQAPERPRELSLSCYALYDDTPEQLSLLDDRARLRRLAYVQDLVNDRYGERTIHLAGSFDTEDFVKTKIPFGSTRYL